MIGQTQTDSPDISPDRLFEALALTWPPASVREQGPFLLRDGAGGGKRVSATSLHANTASDTQLEHVIETMRNGGNAPLFSLLPEQSELDHALEARGFEICDPTLIYVARAADLAPLAPPGIAVLPSDRPLAIQREVWRPDGIGPERLAVMERAKGPKAYLLARHTERPAGTAFVATDGEIAFLHALYVCQWARGMGIGRNLTTGAARWAAQSGANLLALAVTQANAPARAIYERLGLKAVTRYHYRRLTE